MADFFISYASSDHRWAAWIAWQLEEDGYSTAVQAWDFLPGAHFVYEMQKHASTARRTIALLSDDYLKRAFTHAEWAPAFAQDPQGIERRLLPIRVQECTPTGLLCDLIWLDLVGLDESAARASLLSTVTALERPTDARSRRKPLASPPFQNSGEKNSQGHTSTVAQSAFVHAAVRAGGMLELTDAVLPYHAADQATEPCKRTVKTAFVILWFPHAQYLSGSSLLRFTPCVATCTTNFVQVADRFMGALTEHAQAVLSLNPSALRPHEKVMAIRAAAIALDNCFVASIAAPEIMLGVGRSRPFLAYQSMSDLLLLPVAELHRKRGIGRIDIRITHLGSATANVIKCAKRIAVSVFARRTHPAVEVLDDGGLGRPLAALSRIVAWSVGRYYNNGEKRWVTELEKRTEIDLDSELLK